MSFQDDYVAPRNDMEFRVANMWSTLLGVEKISVTSNFFDLGGDSLLAINFLLLAQKEGLPMTPKLLHMHGTVSEISSALLKGYEFSGDDGAIEGEFSLLPMQKYFFDLNKNNVDAHFKFSGFVFSSEKVDRGFLEKTIDVLVVRHKALRSRFYKIDGVWMQRCEDQKTDNRFLQFIDTSSIYDDEKENFIRQCCQVLSVKNGVVFKVFCFEDHINNTSELFFLMHDLIMDFASRDVLLTDFRIIYGQLCRGEKVSLPVETSSLFGWSNCLNAFSKSDEVLLSLEYWSNLPARSSLDIPFDILGNNTVESEEELMIRLDPYQTKKMLKKAVAYFSVHTISMVDIVIASVHYAFYQLNGKKELWLDLEDIGRGEWLEYIDLYRTIGSFSYYNPVLFDSDPELGVKSLLNQVKSEKNRYRENAFNYNILRYICDDQNVRKIMSNIPKPNVLFVNKGNKDNVKPPKLEKEFSRIKTISSEFNFYPQKRRSHAIIISSVVKNGQLSINFSYSKNLHYKETIKTLAKNTLNNIGILIN